MATSNPDIRKAIDAFTAGIECVDQVGKLLARICVEMEHERAPQVQRLLDVELEKLMMKWGSAMTAAGICLPAAERALGLPASPSPRTRDRNREEAGMRRELAKGSKARLKAEQAKTSTRASGLDKFRDDMDAEVSKAETELGKAEAQANESADARGMSAGDIAKAAELPHQGGDATEGSDTEVEGSWDPEDS